MTDPQEDFEAETPEAEAVDAPEAEQDAPEASAVEEEARRLGWKSPDDWKGDPPPRGFMSAEDYLEQYRNTPRNIEKLTRRLEDREREFQARIERIEAANKKALERQRAQIMARMDAAVESADTEAYQAAKKQLADISQPEPEPQRYDGPPPETQAWIARNPWFTTDKVRAAAARAAADQAVAAGITDVKAQLEYVDRVMAETFGGQTKPKQVSAVDAGGMQPPRKREKGVADLPPEAKAAAKQFVADGIYKNEAEYAKDYWQMESGNV